MTVNRHDIIGLPPLPAQWNDLTSGQLEHVGRLMGIRDAETCLMGEEEAGWRFKLRCFLYFLDLKALRKAARDEDGETCFILRRKGFAHISERIPMRAWQVFQWIEEDLSFLDRPFTRYLPPYDFIKAGGRKFKAPGPLMGDMTFRQYLTVQDIADRCIDADETSRKGKAGEGEKELKMLRCRFLAAMFNRPVKEAGEIRDGKYVQAGRHTVWPYMQGQDERNAKYFSRREERVFPVMWQYFQSVQSFYSSDFPDLYTTHKAGKKSYSKLRVEVEMVNNVMKYQGFPGYDSVYEAEAVRVLGVLNTMCREAKEIEKMNQKMRSR